jgi:hypothetical protein
MVARELERRGEEALGRQRQLEEEYERWRHAAPARLSAADAAAIRALAADLPAVWSAATTTPADRRRVARLLLERVMVTVDKASERVDVALHWIGGAVQSQTMARPVGRYAQRSDYARLVERIRVLGGERLSAAQVAERLNAEGFRPPKRAARFRGEMVRRLAASLGLTRRSRDGNTTGLGPDGYRPMALARRLGISRDTVRSWMRAGWVQVRRDEVGQRIIWADASEHGPQFPPRNGRATPLPFPRIRTGRHGRAAGAGRSAWTRV